MVHTTTGLTHHTYTYFLFSSYPPPPPLVTSLHIFYLITRSHSHFCWIPSLFIPSSQEACVFSGGFCMCYSLDMGCSITSAPGTDHSHGSGFAYSAYRRYARACKYLGHTTPSVFHPLYLSTFELIFLIYTIFIDTPPHPPLKKCISHRNASGIKDVVTCLPTPYQDMLHINFFIIPLAASCQAN